MFHEAGTVVHVVVPCGATCQTIAGLGSASVVVTPSATVLATLPFESGFVIVTAGDVLSIRRFEIGVEVETLPATSYATTWRS